MLLLWLVIRLDTAPQCRRYKNLMSSLLYCDNLHHIPHMQRHHWHPLVPLRHLDTPYILKSPWSRKNNLTDMLGTPAKVEQRMFLLDTWPLFSYILQTLPQKIDLDPSPSMVGTIHLQRLSYHKIHQPDNRKSSSHPNRRIFFETSKDCSGTGSQLG
jgi:hypothetical protein